WCEVGKKEKGGQHGRNDGNVHHFQAQIAQWEKTASSIWVQESWNQIVPLWKALEEPTRYEQSPDECSHKICIEDSGHEVQDDVQRMQYGAGRVENTQTSHPRYIVIQGCKGDSCRKQNSYTMIQQAIERSFALRLSICQIATLCRLGRHHAI